MQRSSLRTFPRHRRLALALAGIVCAGADASGAGHLGVLPGWLDRIAATAGGTSRPSATTIVVQNCNDSGAGSLRDALAHVSGETTIDLDALTCSTISLTTGALVDGGTSDTIRIARSAAYVDGRKQPSLTIDAGNISRVIEHDGAGSMYLDGIAVQHGHMVGRVGGCIYAVGALYLNGVSVNACTLTMSGSAYAAGGAIYAKGPLNLNFSTISGNVIEADAGYTYGGGIFSAYSFGAFYSTIDSNNAHAVGYGGGLAAVGNVLIEASLVTGNVARYDGGLALFGNTTFQRGLTIEDSTITLNAAIGLVGGVLASDPLYVYNSTIAFNEGIGGALAGGVVMDGGDSLTIVSTIVADNLAGGASSDISGAGFIDGDHDLVMASSVALPPDTIIADPELGLLADHGGQTRIMPLMPGSPAIDAGDNAINLNCDQRTGNFAGYDSFITTYQRVIGLNADIGAFEFGADDEIFPNGFDPSRIAKHCIRR